MKEEFKKWYESKEGVKSEAYDAFCAGWMASKKICICVNPVLCDLNDKCMKND